MGNDAQWKEAYLKFESPEEEDRKFTKRLRAAGAHCWDRNLEVLELFAGRGGGIRAWETLGFQRVSGLDISAELLSQYRGIGKTLIADARSIPLPDGSMDIISVHGGLHHLSDIANLEKVLDEINRVLRDDGRLLIAEPWMTPFLRAVHLACKIRLARALIPKLDALATMIDLEWPIYHRWLDSGPAILAAIHRRFLVERTRIRLGKLLLVGHPQRC